MYCNNLLSVFLVTCIGCLAFSPLPTLTNAQVISINLTGTFDGTAGVGHPDLNVGDSYEFSVTFDNSDVTGEGTGFLEVFSILTQETRVNGQPVPVGGPVDRIGLFFSGGSPRIFIDATFTPFLNTSFLNPSGFSVDIGTTAEFSDFALIDGPLIGSDFVVQGVGPSDAVRSSQNTISVGSPEPTNREKLDNIILQLEDLLPTASINDQYWIEWAICDFVDAQNPDYFATEDRLSDQGTCFFSAVFWATYSLECVADDALVSDSLIAVDDMLACFVEAEIEFALENPDVNTNLLAYAEFFESFAEAFAEVELYIQAVLLHFYAWWFANNA